MCPIPTEYLFAMKLAQKNTNPFHPIKMPVFHKQVNAKEQKTFC